MLRSAAIAAVLAALPAVTAAEERSDASWIECQRGSEEIDLSAQFPPTDRQRFGDCVVHAESGLLEAAFHRSVRGDPTLERALVGRRLDRSTFFLDSLIESGPGHLNVRAFIAGYGGCAAIARTSRAGIPWSSHKLFGGSFTDLRRDNVPVADLLLCGGEQCSIRTATDYVDDEAIEALLNEKLLAACRRAENEAREMSPDDVTQALRETRQAVRARVSEAPAEEALREALEAKRNSFVRHLLKPKDPPLAGQTLVRAHEDGFSCRTNREEKDYAQRLRALLRGYLCSGLPVAATLKMQRGAGLESSEDAGFSWGPTAHDVPGQPQPPPHRVVLVGMERENGKEYYLFRNSFERGTTDTPHASYLRVETGDACRLSSLGALVTPADEAALSRRIRLGALGDQIEIEDTASIRRRLERRGELPASDGH